MKYLKNFLLCILVFSLINSCQKALEPQNNIVSAGTLVKDGNGNCLPFNINGIYKINNSLNGTHYIDISVDVTTAGDYQIATEMNNGIHFGDTAQFSATGLHIVRLKGYGTPVIAGAFPFTVHYGTSSSCAVTVTVSPANTAAAVFTLTGAPGTCTAPVIQGTYMAGTVLNSFNKLVVTANVTSIGDYTVSTAVVNGIGFSASGTFSTTGNQTITLSGSGTPVAAGSFSMMVTGTATSCSFPLTVDPVSSPDPAKLILISSYNTTSSLSCYNFDRSLKWKRNNLGNTGYRRNGVPSNPLYANGVVYFCEDSIFQVGANYYTVNNFFAIDINTGNNIWTKRSQTDYMQYPIVANGIIYCNFQQSGTNNIAAFNASNGALLWMTPLAEPFGADNFTLDGNTLYFFSVKTPSEIFVNAFDITTKTIKWKIPFGANFFKQPVPMIVEGQILYLEDATEKMIALDKSTGATVWSSGSNVYSRCFFIANNLLYSMNLNNNYNALNLATGAIALSWGTTMSSTQLTRPYPAGNNIYVSGIDVLDNKFIASYNALNGSVNWRVNTSTYVESPIVAGNTMYTMERDFTTGINTMFLFDGNSGASLGTIPLLSDRVGDIRIITAAGKFIFPY
ncbi:MAG: PQQ-binding-like beta-propeller repeat protein [Ferruginibacter sp.]